MRAASSVLLLTILLVTQAEAQNGPSSDTWAPFRYYIGDWSGHETGRAGIGKGDRTYHFEIGGTFIVARNTSRFEPQEKNPEGETHYDWAIFSYDKARRNFVVREFHSEGFVIQYALDTLASGNGLFVFVSETVENAPKGMRARTTLRIEGPDTFLETFELAFPGKEYDEFLRNRWTRRQ